MKKFRSLPLKLAVIEALMEQNLLRKEIAGLKKPQRSSSEALRYFAELDLPESLLARVKILSFEGGNEIYRIVTPGWDGEDEQFTVRDLSDLVHLPNLRSLSDTVLVDVDDAKILRKLPALKSIDIQYGNSIRDEKTLAELEKAGVKIENKPEIKKKSAPQKPDAKLRLALDYDRAQELLWDEEKPAAALKLIENILAQHPRDVDSWFEKGNALDALDKRDAAAEAWQHCLELKKKYPEAHYSLANYYKDRGESAKALMHIEAAIADGMKSSPEAWHIRGQLKIAAGEQEIARENLQKALKLYEKNLKEGDEPAENLFQLACVSALLGNNDSAKDYLRRAVRLDDSLQQRAQEDPDLSGI